jgi:hypothetical protein
MSFNRNLLLLISALGAAIVLSLITLGEHEYI